MSVFSDASSDETMMRDGRGPGPVPVGLENARAAAYMQDRLGGAPAMNPNEMAGMQPNDYTQVADNTNYQGDRLNRGGISTRIQDRIESPTPIVGRDGQREQLNPIHQVNNYDRSGNIVGTSEYNYTPNEGTGVKMNGYVDRDANGNIKEFAVRKPALYADQKDCFMVFKATPGHPIDEQQMQHVQQLLRPDVPPEQRMANQMKLNEERPLADNLVHNINKQILSLKLDPQTGQRFEVRDMRVDPNTGRQIASDVNFVLCWKGPQGENFRTSVSNLSKEDKADLSNALFHGNMRTPLRFLTEASQGNRVPVGQRQMQERYRDQPGRGQPVPYDTYQDQQQQPPNVMDQNPPVFRRNKM